jgi:hypothetical protein
MTDEQSKMERKGPAPSRRRRARTSDADAEVNPPGEPSSRRAAPGWERRSKEMPGRMGTMKTAPWKTNERTTGSDEANGEDEDFDDEDEDFETLKRPPTHEA